MHSSLALLARSVVVIFGVLVSTQLAAASPAEPYHTSECQTLPDDTVYCYESKGVSHTTTTPSGNFVWVIRDTTTYTLTLDGTVIESGVIKGHYVETAEDGLTQVNRYHGSREFSYTDSTTGLQVECTFTYNFIYANGSIRHDVESLECE